MSGLAALVAAVAVAGPARIVAIRSETLQGRQALTVVTAGDTGEVAVRREGAEVVIVLGADVPANLAAPSVSPPIESVRIEKTRDGLALRVRVAPEVLYEVRREQAALTVVFGAAAADPPQPTAPSSDVAELYKSILPPAAEEPGRPVPGATPAKSEGTRPGPGGLTLRPSVAATYVDAESTVLATPKPVKDHYYEILPRLAAQMPLGDGKLAAGYEAHIRRASAFEIVRETSHAADAGLDLPLGPSVTLRGSGHYSRGVLETNEVDPGREYFFKLGRFTRRSASAGARIQTGGRLDVDLTGSLNDVNVAEDAGFFSYRSESVGASLGFGVGASLRAALAYSYDRVPAPRDRPEAQSEANSVSLQLNGDILPLLTGEVSVGYRDQKSPHAAAGGTRYRGLAASVRLTKEFSRGSRLSLSGSRSTPLSNFEGNAFYVSTSTDAELTFSLPLSFSARSGAGYHWNDYRTVATGLDVPRKERLFGWSVGLGRSLTRWAYLRTDYRKDRRESNLDVFDTRTRSLTVQVGVGLFGAPEKAK